MVTVPFDLRVVLATRADAMSAVLRIAIDEISRAYRDGATSRGLVDPRFGAITFVHRFGGSLNLNVHFHIAALDGVFTDGGAHFVAADPPSAEQLRTVVERIQRRVARWWRRRHKRTAPAGPPEGTGLEQVGVQRGLFATVDEKARRVDDDERDASRFDPRRTSNVAVSHEGFSIHAGVTVAAWDRDGRERLCRYGARSPFSLAKLSRLDDGRIAYRTKYPGPHGHTHRVMEPVEFLARIASLIPPPRYPLVRYHGVLAPNSSWRSKVVPRREATPERVDPCHPRVGGEQPNAKAPSIDACIVGANDTDSVIAAIPVSRGGATEKPQQRIGRGLFGTPAGGDVQRRPDRRRMERIDWAELLRRIYNVDALRCPRCCGRLQFIASITERSAIQRVLEHLGESATGPPPKRIVDAWAAG